MIFPLVTAAMLALRIPFAVIASMLMLLGAQWYVLFNVLAGASAIPHDLEEASETYHVGGVARWRKLFLPAVFPYLVTGLITAAGGAWNASIVAETLEYQGRTPRDLRPRIARSLTPRSRPTSPCSPRAC